jgi:hypothetical protein
MWIKLIAQGVRAYGSAGTSQIELQDKNEVIKNISSWNEEENNHRFNQESNRLMSFTLYDLRLLRPACSGQPLKYHEMSLT